MIDVNERSNLRIRPATDIDVCNDILEGLTNTLSILVEYVVGKYLACR